MSSQLSTEMHHANPPVTESDSRNSDRLIGIILVLLAFCSLTTGIICSKNVLPQIYHPLLAGIAGVGATPLMLFAVIKLGDAE